MHTNPIVLSSYVYQNNTAGYPTTKPCPYACGAYFGLSQLSGWSPLSGKGYFVFKEGKCSGCGQEVGIVHNADEKNWVVRKKS